MKKDLLSCQDIDRKDMETIFDLAAKLKAGRGKPNQPRPLEGKSIGMIFAKSSTRTRVSFEVGIHELGGQPIYLDESKTQMGRGETIADTARVLSRFLHGIVIRTFPREPLNLSADELVERFVQGDNSRKSEGNGLGLSIAKSLTELQNGTMELSTDGDLFKVVLRFPTIG